MPPKKKGSELDLFLKNKITRKNQLHTHTRIGDPESEPKIYGGCYSISDIDEDEFWKKYYKKVFKDKQKEYLTEKQFDEGPMLVDIDLQYDTNIDSRQHTDQHIFDLLKLYNLSHDEICHTVIMAHTEKQEKKKSLGKNITAYDLWRSDFDNRGDNQHDRDLDTEW